MSKDWQIRPYKEGDAAKIAEGWTNAFAADGLEFVMSETELLSKLDRPGFDLSRHTLVVDGPPVEGLPEDMIAGFAWLLIREDPAISERTYRIRVIVHPSARPLGLEHVLAQRLIEIAREHEADPTTVPMSNVNVQESFSPKQESQHRLYKEMGFHQIRVFWTMECSLDSLPQPGHVVGVRLRGFRKDEDAAAGLDALNNSFIDHFDFHPPTEEIWSHRLDRPGFRPDLSWVGEIEAEPGKLAGFCYCGIIEEENQATGRFEGWIETLGTIRGWRGKGLGRALLLHGLHSLKAEGMTIGMLGVDSANPTGATELYKSVGFKIRDEWLSYECDLRKVKI